MAKEKIIVDDGRFYIALNANHDANSAPGFLEIRCSQSVTTPGCYDCIGSFDKAPDGKWRASIAAPRDPETDEDSRIVAKGVTRMEAIVSLWRARHAAYGAHRR